MPIPTRYIIAFVVATLAALPGFALGRGTVAYPATVQTAFSPGGGAPRLVIAAIDRARARVLVAIYSFSHPEIAKALVAAKRRGVDVAVVMDADQAGRRYSGAQFLANQGVPVFLVNRYQAMHQPAPPSRRTPRTLTSSPAPRSPRSTSASSTGWKGRGAACRPDTEKARRRPCGARPALIRPGRAGAYFLEASGCRPPPQSHKWDRANSSRDALPLIHIPTIAAPFSVFHKRSLVENGARFRLLRAVGPRAEFLMWKCG